MQEVGYLEVNPTTANARQGGSLLPEPVEPSGKNSPLNRAFVDVALSCG
jgi:hypothetical protein